jgi:hypothetical protein
MRQAPERVAKLALLDTGARGEAVEQTERRKAVIALAKSGRYAEVADIAFPIYVQHRNRHQDAAVKQCAQWPNTRAWKRFCVSSKRSWAGRTCARA